MATWNNKPQSVRQINSDPVGLTNFRSCPLRYKAAFAIENLDAGITTIGNIQPARVVNCKSMRQIEFALSRPFVSPLELELVIRKRRPTMNNRVAAITRQHRVRHSEKRDEGNCRSYTRNRYSSDLCQKVQVNPPTVRLGSGADILA